jgi:hypothetical protein
MTGYGAAVTDFDGDGRFEVFVTSFGGPNRVLKWQGGGLVDAAPGLLADVGRQAIGVAAGDLTGDGREEIYLMNSDTFAGRKRFADRLFAWDGDAWEDLFERPGSLELANLIAGRSVAVIDRRGDGRYGFFTANYGAPMRLYEMDDLGNLIDAAPETGVDLVSGGRSLLPFQLTSYRMDLFVGNETGPNFMLVNDGAGRFRDVAPDLRLDDPDEHARGVAVLDLNGNGLFDLVVGNWEGRHRLFVQDESGAFEDHASESFSRSSRVRNVLVADFDNDGLEEIFFNNIGQTNRLFRNLGGVLEEIDPGAAAEPGGLGTGAVVGDFDEDGTLELLIVHGESGMQPLTLHKAEPVNDGWLRVLPLTRSGAPARGSTVTLVGAESTRRRVIDAGSGYLCQMEPVAHFSFSAGDEPERVIVRWPGGEMKVIESPESNRLHQVEIPISEKPGLRSGPE